MDEKNIQKYLSLIDMKSTKKTVSKRAQWESNNWIVTDEKKIEQLKEQQKMKKQKEMSLNLAKNFLSDIRLYNAKKKQSVITGIGKNKCEFLALQKITTLRAFCNMKDYNAKIYLGSKDVEKRDGVFRADLKLKAKVELAKSILCDKKEMNDWESFLLKEQQCKQIVIESKTKKNEITTPEVQQTKEKRTISQSIKPEITEYCQKTFSLSRKTVENICAKKFEMLEPIMKQELSSNEPTNVWKVDETFKIASVLKVAHPLDTNTRYQPFRSCMTVKNAYSEYLAIHFLYSEGKFTETSRYLEKLLQQSRDQLGKPQWTPRVLCCDNCCQMRSAYTSIFGSDISVVLDLWHWLNRWNACIQLRPGHPRRRQLFRALTDAVLVPDATEYFDYKQEYLSSLDEPYFSNVEATQLEADLHHEISKKCKRQYRDPLDMEAAVTAVLGFFLYIDEQLKLQITVRQHLLNSNRACEGCKGLREQISQCDSCMSEMCDLTFKVNKNK
ncbi:MAG: hypothetical protein AB8F74_15890 [Saprospiraceae bacterium]